MLRSDPAEQITATSADWTRGYKCALANIDEPIGDYTKSEREMFMRGYQAGIEASDRTVATVSAISK